MVEQEWIETLLEGHTAGLTSISGELSRQAGVIEKLSNDIAAEFKVLKNGLYKQAEAINKFGTETHQELGVIKDKLVEVTETETHVILDLIAQVQSWMGEWTVSTGKMIGGIGEHYVALKDQMIAFSIKFDKLQEIIDKLQDSIDKLQTSIDKK